MRMNFRLSRSLSENEQILRRNVTLRMRHSQKSKIMLLGVLKNYSICAITEISLEAKRIVFKRCKMSTFETTRLVIQNLKKYLLSFDP